jgi:hypothetical protein
MNSNKDKFYIKIVALDLVYNFLVEMFYLNLKLFRVQNIIVSSHIL